MVDYSIKPRRGGIIVAGGVNRWYSDPKYSSPVGTTQTIYEVRLPEIRELFNTSPFFIGLTKS